jgi:hypothetical protein
MEALPFLLKKRVVVQARKKEYPASKSSASRVMGGQGDEGFSVILNCRTGRCDSRRPLSKK